MGRYFDPVWSKWVSAPGRMWACAALKLLSSPVLHLIIVHLGADMKEMKISPVLGMGTDLKSSKGFMDTLPVL